MLAKRHFRKLNCGNGWKKIKITLSRRRGVVIITTAQLHSTKPELKFSAGSNPAHGVSEISDGEDLSDNGPEQK